jgi:hypothetical protein
MEGLSILNAMIAPAALITACSLFLLGVYDKFSKIAVSLRTLNSEQRALLFSVTDEADPERERRLSQIGRDWALLRRRLDSTLRQLQCIEAATALFLLSSLLIACQMVFHVPTIAGAVVIVCIGVLALMASMIQALGEARTIRRLLVEETSTLSDPSFDEPLYFGRHLDKSLISEVR